MAGLERLAAGRRQPAAGFRGVIWHNDTLPATNKLTWVLGNIPSLAFVTVGAVVVARRPGNRIGWLC